MLPRKLLKGQGALNEEYLQVFPWMARDCKTSLEGPAQEEVQRAGLAPERRAGGAVAEESRLLC